MSQPLPMDTLQKHPHRRYNPLLDEWVIVSPHRLQRPWDGKHEKPVSSSIPNRDSSNPLCPGSVRPNGQVNPEYTATFLFQNDFPALKPEEIDIPDSSNPLFRAAPARGDCFVMCFHPRSDLQLATMPRDDVVKVIQQWQKETARLSQLYEWVQIFENKGAIQGCSNPHPHCQIWCCNFLPNDPRTKDRTQMDYFHKFGKQMLLDYAKQELELQDRIVVSNPDWVVAVPFWASWPFETILVPARRHIRRLTDLTEAEVANLADAVQRLLVKYDNLFQCSFPYSMGWIGAPTGKYLTEDTAHWQLHATWLPPLLRSASVKKFVAGFELLCEKQRDLTPETAAAQLRALPDVHYLAVAK